MYISANLAGHILESVCLAMLQKDLREGLKDEKCGRPVEKGHAGLCV